METGSIQPVDYVPDIVVLSKDEKIVLLVEVKSKKSQDWQNIEKSILPIKHYLQNRRNNSPYNLANEPFILFVDLDKMIIWKWNIDKFSEPLIYLKTDDVLSNYDQEFSKLSNNNRISAFYLETLVEAWLRDLAHHWKSEKPPEWHKLQAICLLQLIEEGTTHSQVNLNDNALR
ncbi:hypothetical protein [Anabaena azotica]|uniref:Type I restriction enzyme R protein N-terminal domain-containing protein n=1 Tax=Anabaena azotica FACHB-119 TaxID=947527 RepID=A0ABR8D5N8_9NOST|nr:hypothetical protein [Anabaena azotica]MBD2501068.1 hypothetical protein [Anabaena azotica FACHB-119]